MFNYKVDKNNEQSDLKPIGEKDDDSDDMYGGMYNENQDVFKLDKVNEVILNIRLH